MKCVVSSNTTQTKTNGLLLTLLNLEVREIGRDSKWAQMVRAENLLAIKDLTKIALQPLKSSISTNSISLLTKACKPSYLFHSQFYYTSNAIHDIMKPNQ